MFIQEFYHRERTSQMKRIDISEKEYLVLMTFIQIAIREKECRWKLQAFLPEHFPSEEDVNYIYDLLLDFHPDSWEKLTNLINREKIVLLKFVSQLLETRKQEGLFLVLCLENKVSPLKLSYIVFSA